MVGRRVTGFGPAQSLRRPSGALQSLRVILVKNFRALSMELCNWSMRLTPPMAPCKPLQHRWTRLEPLWGSFVPIRYGTCATSVTLLTFAPSFDGMMKMLSQLIVLCPLTPKDPRLRLTTIFTTSMDWRPFLAWPQSPQRSGASDLLEDG